MARFNQASVVKNKTTNLAGGNAYVESPKLELVSILLTFFVKNQYYRGANDTLKQVVKLIDIIPDKKFVAKAAVFARNEFGMRSISHVVAAEIAAKVKFGPATKGNDKIVPLNEKAWTRQFMTAVVRRVDDMAEILAYYLSKYGKPIPNCIKQSPGFRSAIGKFDAYQLGKWRSEGKALSLIDIVNLVHPVPTARNAEALKQLVTGTLKSTDTWEAKLTGAGQKATSESEKKELKAEAWTKLIKTKKIGYFALLRNLRNIIEQAPEIIDEACALLCDERLIKGSLVLPFRFAVAIDEIAQHDNSASRKVMTAISDAIDISCNNVPELDGETLVVCDYSGSMGLGKNMSEKRAIGSLFGIILAKKNNADFMIFGSRAAYVNFNQSDSTLGILRFLNTLNRGHPHFRSRHIKPGPGKYEVDHGTSFDSIFDTANKGYKRIVIFSDMQCWEGRGQGAPIRVYNDYRKKFNCNPHIYSIDLAGYGSLAFPEKQIYALAGFSDKMFDLMSALEQDRNALIDKIEKIEF